MNISPILLLAIGSTFALAYALIITVGWAITRKNRRLYQNATGCSEVELYDMVSCNPMKKKIKTISLENNFFISNQEDLDIKVFDCYIVEVPSPKYPDIKKGDLIFIEPSSNKIKYAFKVPDLKSFR